MKTGFWAGVISAIVAGLAIFFFQQYYTEWRSANATSINVRVNDDAAVINNNNIGEIQNSAHIRTGVTIASFVIRNSGSSPVNNGTIHFSRSIQPEGRILSYGVVPGNGGDSSTVVFQPSASGFDVTLRSLPVSESQTFWVAYPCCEIFYVAPLTPGLSVSSSVSDFDETGDLWRWFERLLILIFAFIGGGVLESAITANRLKRRGYKLFEMLQKPKLAPEESAEE
jgi:hypothetical protein